MEAGKNDGMRTRNFLGEDVLCEKGGLGEIDVKRRIFAGSMLLLLIVVPFVDWRLGAVMWMSAWLVFIFQKLFDRRRYNLGEDDVQSGRDDKSHLE